MSASAAGRAPMPRQRVAAMANVRSFFMCRVLGMWKCSVGTGVQHACAGKDSANERKEKGKRAAIFCFFPECSLILWKDSANERKEKGKRAAIFCFFPECSLIMRQRLCFLRRWGANGRQRGRGAAKSAFSLRPSPRVAGPAGLFRGLRRVCSRGWATCSVFFALCLRRFVKKQHTASAIVPFFSYLCRCKCARGAGFPGISRRLRTTLRR